MNTFHDLIYQYFRENMRLFPWRETADPYRILVSEIMLQQTRTERVTGKYEAFIETFPDFFTLARADLAEVLTIWQGLGYNRRALNLKKAAEIVIRDFGGRLPDTHDELICLPGIGRATAGAVLAFAFNQPAVFVETNIRRVFIHFFFQDRQGIQDKEILPLVEKTLDRNNPRNWYYALMDYGAVLAKCVPNPNRKSAHYKRQARFEGSDRQIRGMIIKTIVASGSIKEHELADTLGTGSSRLRKIIADMKKEGLIAQESSSLRIA